MGERSATIDRDAPSNQVLDPGLRPATAGDIGRLKAVMAEAFFEDPIYGWLMPNELRVGGSPPLRLMLRPSTPSEVKR
jgi:hypothetical protein